MAKKNEDWAFWLGIAKALIGIGSVAMTLYQATKKCPCDGNALPFKVQCPVCGHNHFF